jgi:anti-anti-sigma regulatory factor
MDSARPVGRTVGRRAENKLKKTHRDHGGRTCIVDLTDVTFLDKGGERLLRTMSKEGAQFIATGIYIKHVLQQRCAR